MEESIFIAKDVVKEYGDYIALNKVSITVPKGSIYGLLGPNGAGKTTLMRIINQITAPDSGSLIFDGAPLSKHHISDIGYLPEERGLYKKMRVGEQALYLAQLKGMSYPEALEKLKQLSDYELHSIEQPIQQGQLDKMAQLCSESPLPIALDEELIGVFSVTNKEFLLQTIKPQYIILKPTLVGGFKGSQDWIDLAESKHIGWWVTSALESNIGLNAIAQWTYTLKSQLPQGLGTGGLFTNNIQAPLTVAFGQLFYDLKTKWNLKF